MDLFSHIRSQVPIEDVVREYVALKPAGAYLKGFSPFKQEKTPSFTVSPARGIYYCFSTGNGGDAVDFVAKMERCSQGEAARILIERFHLEIPASVQGARSEANGEQRQIYRKLCAFFTQWCSAQLRHHAAAKAYVARRNLNDLTVADFQIGYCPSGSADAFLKQAREEGFLPSHFVDAHLLVATQHGFSFTFEDRIIFPIANHMGSICGFGGRTFRPSDERPKYLNSRDHEQFNKKQIVYGLWQAKKAIQATGVIYLVEGYIDCLAMAQAGYTATVATLGTACTQEHLTLLARYGRQLVVLYDGDEAGQKAIMRLTQLCWQSNLEIAVLQLPAEDDPASYLEKNKDLMGLGAARSLFNFFIASRGLAAGRQSSAQKVEAIHEILQLVVQVPDELRREMLLQQASVAFDLPMAILHRELGRLRHSVARTVPHGASSVSQPEIPPVASLPPLDILEERLFSVILNNGISVCEEESVFLMDQFSEPIKRLFGIWRSVAGDFDAFLGMIEGDDRLLVLRCAALEVHSATTVYRELLGHLQKRRWRELLAAAKKRLAHADATEKGAILEEVQKLQMLMVRKG